MIERGGLTSLAPTRSAFVHQMDYYPHLDGLRALAILSVIGYHFFPNVIPGGFVGVDVFFVISGFLITGIIIKKLQQGIFSFSDFYARRIKRIFPALILILVFCIGVGYSIMLPAQFRELGKYGLGSTIFLPNFFFWRGEIHGYFAATVETKPLLHLWSLGIEEQYYLLWPVLLYLFFCRKWKTIYIVSLLLILSFVNNSTFGVAGYRLHFSDKMLKKL